MKKQFALVGLAVVFLCACGGSSRNYAPPTAATATIVKPASTPITVAWELDTRADDPNRPKTHVTVVANGATPDRIDGGELFGECHPMSGSTWLAAENPLATLACGYAGNFQNIGIFQVGSTLVLKAQPVMDDSTPPPAPNLLGQSIAIPTNAAITIAPTIASAPLPPSEKEIARADGRTDRRASSRAREASGWSRFPQEKRRRI